ncbi:MAG TPA: PD-(D/E)XK nuclease family transposase, partial [Saprospiraceae bacterium]|nr:PD-(D/E)XK nuclease family transposase [Saprospiraceae bacterium]
MRYLDPKNDLIFKRVFGEHPKITISFLNALLPLETGQEILEIEYMQTELIPESPEILKNSIVDVRCRDSFGRQFIVEMQMFWTDAFINRVLFNATKVFYR